MQPNEMEIIRAVTVKLDESKVFVLTYQYHTEKDKDAIPGAYRRKGNDRAKSRYRMLGRVMDLKEVESLSREMLSDKNRLNEWKWPDDPSWDGCILYSKDHTNYQFSNWLRNRIKPTKTVNWDVYLKLLDGFKRDVSCDRNKPTYIKNPELMYTIFTPNAVYEKKGYTCSDGSVIDLTDREALISKKGQNIVKEIQMKLVGPQNAKAAGGENAEDGQAQGEN